MNLTEAILTRRTIKEFTAAPVPDDVLERALTAGTWAQNHKMTEPWRFIVLGPETHKSLAGDDPKLLSRPRIVAVTTVLAADPFTRREDYAAVCCAIQNIQLAAWAEGVGMQWSTGRVATSPATYPILDIDPEKEEIAGLLFFGYPASVPAARPRKPLADVMRKTQ